MILDDIRALPSRILIQTHSIALDTPVRIPRGDRSLRAYLLELAVDGTSGLEKAVRIVALLKLEAPRLSDLQAALAGSRVLPFGKTSGTQLLEGLLSISSAAAAGVVASHLSVAGAGTDVSDSPAIRAPERLKPSPLVYNTEALRGLQTFPDVHPRHYRRDIYAAIDLSNPAQLSLIPVTDVSSKPIDFPASFGGDHYLIADRELHGEVNQWIPLETLSSTDYVKLTTPDYQLGYAKLAGQYYVRATRADTDFRVSYELYPGRLKAVDSADSDSLSYYLDELNKFEFGDAAKEAALKEVFQYASPELNAQVLQAFLKTFKEEPLSRSVDTFSQGALNLMLHEHKGVCHQRAVIFMAFASLLEMPAQMIENGIHAFCELRIKDRYSAGPEHWVTVDLGGGTAAPLVITPSTNTKASSTNYWNGADGLPFQGISIQNDGRGHASIKLHLWISDYYKPQLPGYLGVVNEVLGLASGAAPQKEYKLVDPSQGLAILEGFRKLEEEKGLSFYADRIQQCVDAINTTFGLSPAEDDESAASRPGL